MPEQTIREGLELLAYFFLGFLIVKTVTKRKQIMRIFYVLVGVGVFQAVYGFIQLYSNNPRLLFYKKIYGLDSLSGTFVNRNHLSGYLEMVIPLTIGLILAHIDVFSLAGLKWREKLLRFSEKGFYRNMLLTFGVIVMAMAILFSKSRSGVFLLVFAFILFFGLAGLYSGRVTHRQKWTMGFLKGTFLAIMCISLYVGINATIERFALDNLLYQNRPLYWSNTTRITNDFPFPVLRLTIILYFVLNLGVFFPSSFRPLSLSPPLLVFFLPLSLSSSSLARILAASMSSIFLLFS
ncbi:hypothetical protein ES703_106844 [subsurface metagenome]